MTVDIALYRTRTGLFNRYEHVKSTYCFTFLPYALPVLLAQLILIVAFLLIRCGDVEINPVQYHLTSRCGVQMFVI